MVEPEVLADHVEEVFAEFFQKIGRDKFAKGVYVVGYPMKDGRFVNDVRPAAFYANRSVTVDEMLYHLEKVRNDLASDENLRRHNGGH